MSATDITCAGVLRRCAALFAFAWSAAACAASPAHGGYVVAVDSETAARPEWKKVAHALCRKHGGAVVTYPRGDTDALLPQFRSRAPRFVCFVSAPECAGRALVVGAAQTIRRIDDDPFGDALWGVVTGYAAADAMRIASLDKPLVVHSAATSMGGRGFFNDWDCGFASDEGNRNRFWTKAPGAGEATCRDVAPDPARALADSFNSIPIDYWCTSGHATERNWQIVFNQNAGFIVHRDGALMARDSAGATFPIRSPGAKVYVAAGNCLIGHIDRRDCMATAWMHSGGVVQMAGYTVVTFYGFMGWGVKSLFESGRHSLAEAFFLNNQILLWKLGRMNPALVERRLDAKGKFSPGAVSASLKGVVRSHDEFGLFWDRDAMAFYGDPAWRATCQENRRGMDVSVKGDEIKIRFLRKTDFPDSPDHKDMRPVAAMLPTPPPKGAWLADAGTGAPVGGAVVTELFALIPVTGRHEAGEVLRYRYRKGK